MDELKYMLKPDWVSWDSIKECMVLAHESNNQKGFKMYNSMMSSQEIEQYLKNGYCFVAILGDRVVGTNSLKVIKINTWWAKGNVGYECLTAIIPEFRNTGAYFGLRKIRTEYAKKLGINILQFDTHEENKNVQMIDQKLGFKYVRFFSSSQTNYYSVVMAKWLNGCPYSDRYCIFRFRLSKIVTKLLFKPGRKFRFKFW